MHIKTILSQSTSAASLLLFAHDAKTAEADRERMKMIAALSTARPATRNDKRRLGIKDGDK